MDLADFPLDDRLAQSLIVAQFPALRPVRISARYEGMDHHAVEINGSWIFRFPKRAEGEPMLARELQLLPEITPRIRVQAPRYEFIGVSSHDFPCIFAGYRKIAGTPALDFPPGALVPGAIVRQLSSVISAIHAFPIRVADQLGVVDLEEFEDIERLRASTLDEIAEIANAVPARTLARCRAFVDDAGSLSTPPVTSRGLLHGDLSAEHILVEPAAGQIFGIIDWADACVGDRAYDFKFLWVWLGEDAVRRLLSQHDRNVDVGFLDRVRYYGICTAIGELAYGLSTGRERNLRLGREALVMNLGE